MARKKPVRKSGGGPGPKKKAKRQRKPRPLSGGGPGPK